MWRTASPPLSKMLPTGSPPDRCEGYAQSSSEMFHLPFQILNLHCDLKQAPAPRVAEAAIVVRLVNEIALHATISNSWFTSSEHWNSCWRSHSHYMRSLLRFLRIQKLEENPFSLISDCSFLPWLAQKRVLGHRGTWRTEWEGEKKTHSWNLAGASCVFFHSS